MSHAALPTIRAITDPQEVSLADILKEGDLPAELILKAAPRHHPRSTVQIAIDHRVNQVYHEWVASGRKESWLDCPHAFYAVPPSKAKSMRDKIREAGRLLRVQIWFGRTDLYDERGNALIAFTVIDHGE